MLNEKKRLIRVSQAAVYVELLPRTRQLLGVDDTQHTHKKNTS